MRERVGSRVSPIETEYSGEEMSHRVECRAGQKRYELVAINGGDNGQLFCLAVDVASPG